MLPIPFINYIPSFFTRGDSLLALANKTDEHLSEWRDDICNLNTIIDPVRIPEFLLDDIGNYLNAGILTTDSSRTKRQKIWNAVETHRFRGTWKFDVKPTIDSIIGGDAALVSSADNSEFILLGQEEGDPNFFWGTIGIDGIDDQLGADIVGDGTELTATGVFLIDVGTGVESLQVKCTSDDIEKSTSDDQTKCVFNVDVAALKFALEDKIPTYYRVFLGYMDNGEFVIFADGQIN